MFRTLLQKSSRAWFVVRYGVFNSNTAEGGRKVGIMPNQFPNWIASIWYTSPTRTRRLKEVLSSTLIRSALLTVLHSSITRRLYSGCDPLVRTWLAIVRNVDFCAVTLRRRLSTAGLV
jgi:hypothetical protein